MVVAEPTAGTWLPLLHAIRTAIANIVGQDNRRIPTVRQDGTDRCGAQVAELTDELDLWGWPEGTKFIVRCERRDLGAQQSLFPFEAFRYWGHDNRRRRR